MADFEAAHLLGQAGYLVLMLSLPAVGATAVVGILVGLLQGLTQIQDQTISFALRLSACALTLILTADWMGNELSLFADRALTLILDR